MSKILFFNVPGHGHINPTVPVVETLVANGHEVIYYNVEGFGNKVLAAGATFRAYPVQFDASTHDVRQLPKIYYHIWQGCESLVNWLVDEINHQRPDCIVHDSLCAWGKIAAELAKVPAICSHTFFIFNTRSIINTIISNPSIIWQTTSWLGLKNLSYWWEAKKMKDSVLEKFCLNKAKYRNTFSNEQEVNIIFTSRHIHPDTLAPEEIEKYHFVGASIPAKRQQTNTQIFDNIYLKDKGNVPIIYVSLGTGQMNNRIEPFKKIIASLGGQAFRVIMSIGNYLKISDLGIIPNNISVLQTVPQLHVLSKADLFITHAGMNSMHESLVNGVPMIALPMQGEQFVNAHRIEEMGCGLMMNIENIKQDDLLKKVHYLLENYRVKSNTQAVGEALKRAGGVTKATAIITQTARANKTNKLAIPIAAEQGRA